MAFDANPRYRVPSTSASAPNGEKSFAGGASAAERNYRVRGEREKERRAAEKGEQRLAGDSSAGGGRVWSRERGSERNSRGLVGQGRDSEAAAALERSRDRLSAESGDGGRRLSVENGDVGRRLLVENGDGGRRGRDREEEAVAGLGRYKVSREDAVTGRFSERDHSGGGRNRGPEALDRGRDRLAGEDGGRGRVDRDYGRGGRDRGPELDDRGRGRFSREIGARARVDRDISGRGGERERGEMDAGRGVLSRQSYSSRDPGRDLSRGDSSRHAEGARGRGDGGNVLAKYRLREGQTGNDRNRDDPIRLDRQPLTTGSRNRAQSGEGDRVSSSSLSAKPASSGSHSATFSFLHSSVSTSSDHNSLSVKRDSGRVVEARSSAGAPPLTQDEGMLHLAGEDHFDDIEPGELLSGGIPAESREQSPQDLQPQQTVRSREECEEQGVDEPRVEFAAPSPRPTKRKFTPVVWDYEEKQDQKQDMRPTGSRAAASSISDTSSLHTPHPSRPSPAEPPPDAAVMFHFSPLRTMSPSPNSQPVSGRRAAPAGRNNRSSSSESLSSPSSPSSPSSLSSPLSLSSGEIRSPRGLVAVGKKERISTETQEERTIPVEYGDGVELMEDEDKSGSPESGEVTELHTRFGYEQVVGDGTGPEPGELPAGFESRQEGEDDTVIAVNISTSRWASDEETPNRGNSPRRGSKEFSHREGEKSRTFVGPNGRHDDDAVGVNISTSRWATEEGTPDWGNSRLESKEQISNLQGEKSRTLAGLNGRHVAHSASKSPEKNLTANGKGSISDNDKASHNPSAADEEYEQRLNDRELMELDEEESEGDEEEQRPEGGSDIEEAECKAPGSPFRVIDMLQGCRSVNEFQMVSRIDEGTYGVVYQARDKKTGEVVALKKVKMETEKDGFPMTALREMNVLLSIHHPSVVNVKEVVVGSTIDSIYMVMEYMEHELKGLMETLQEPFSQSEVKCLMLQLLDGVNYLHGNWVLHRDLKTSNLLLNNCGELKICDFGLARQYGSPLQVYSHRVVTLWYRAPELLLGSKQYSTAIDMWSLGCIMAELMEKKPLLDGKSEIEQINKIFSLLGTPNKEIWPDFVNLPGAKANFVNQKYNMLRDRFPAASFGGKPALSESGFDLLNRLLTYDPKQRISAEAAMNHPWFREEPQAKAKEAMPAYPPRSKHDRKLRRLMKSPDPLAEQHRREIREGQQGPTSIFGIV